jgi:hypothetical protein
VVLSARICTRESELKRSLQTGLGRFDRQERPIGRTALEAAVAYRDELWQERQQRRMAGRSRKPYVGVFVGLKAYIERLREL